MKSSNIVWKNLKEWFKVIFVALIIAFLLQNFLLSSTIVDGSSMFLTLETGDRLFVNRFFLSKKKPKRGNIVEIKAPDGTNRDFIKRVIAVSGDVVEIKDGKVYVNGHELEESYIKGNFTMFSGKSRWKVGENQIFVLGDNRTPGGSLDSRSFGTIEIDKVVGIAFFRFYPFNKFGILR